VVRKTKPYTRNVEWLTEKDRLLAQFFPQRTERIVQQFINAGLYPGLAAPELSETSGTFTSPFDLKMTAPAGTIYYTTNGHDPRLPGGSIAPEAQIYKGPLPFQAKQQSSPVHRLRIPGAH
jgi:hypothetical protein